MITRRTLLKTTVGSLAALGASLIGADRLMFPKLENKADGSRVYDYVYGMPKSEAIEFVLTNMSENGRFCFGTSEFYFSKDLIPEVPQAVFGEHNTGVDMTVIGQPYDQSLWQAIACGAYMGRAKNHECVLFVSPQWFFKGNGSRSNFTGLFNYELYRAFCQNTMISGELKATIRQHVLNLGIDAGTVAAANQDTPADALNDLQKHEQNTLRIRSELEKMVTGAPSKSRERAINYYTSEPDWETLLAQASDEGANRCTNNDFGIYDSYWTRNSHFSPEQNQTFDKAEDEWGELNLFFRVAQECGASTLVVMLPMHGPWYDRVGVPQETRDGYYQRLRDVTDTAGVTCADFSPFEYERYFFADTVHPGWRGWVHIERAIYHFIMGQDDDCLGGWGYGTATAEGLDDMRGAKGDV